MCIRVHTYTHTKVYKISIYPNPYTNIRLKQTFGVLDIIM